MLFSCENMNNREKCPSLRYEHGDKVIYLKDSLKIEVIVNYCLHAVNHDTINGGKIICRYRVSWIDSNNINQNEMIYEENIE